MKKIDGVMELLQKFQGDKKKLEVDKNPTEKEKELNDSLGTDNNKDPKKSWNFNRKSPNKAISETEC